MSPPQNSSRGHSSTFARQMHRTYALGLLPADTEGICRHKKNEARNLLVPVAFSASHVAYSSVRMEPQYMILGQAAGAAAKMAIETRRAVQEIDSARLTARLRKRGVVMEYIPSTERRVIPLFRK